MVEMEDGAMAGMAMKLRAVEWKRGVGSATAAAFASSSRRAMTSHDAVVGTLGLAGGALLPCSLALRSPLEAATARWEL